MAIDYAVHLTFPSVCSSKYPTLFYVFPWTNLFIPFLQEVWHILETTTSTHFSTEGRNFQAPYLSHCPRISYEQTFEQKKLAASSSSSATARHDFNQIEVSSFYLFSPSVSPSVQKGSSSFLHLIYILRGLSPRANYTDRAAAAGRRS